MQPKFIGKKDRCAMQAYDALPQDLRSWLALACLRWSLNPALKIWKRADGNTSPIEALSQLHALEQAMLQCDKAIWYLKA